jgi:hypothetical protein
MGAPRTIDTPERAKADRIRNRYNAEIEQIRGQRNLSDAGRRARLAQAVIKAKSDLEKLRATENEHITSRRDQILRNLFGHVRPNDARIVNIRSAEAIAAQVKTPDEAATLMNDAENNDDEVLLRILARKCVQRRNPLEPDWNNLFETWAALQPGGPEALNELALIGDETTDTGHRILRERAFGLPALPKEIAGIGNLKPLADQADNIPELPPTRGEQIGQHLAKFAHATIE